MSTPNLYPDKALIEKYLALAEKHQQLSDNVGLAQEDLRLVRKIILDFWSSNEESRDLIIEKLESITAILGSPK